MSLKTRVKNLEKKMGADKECEVPTRLIRSSPEEWKLKKMVHEARKILGLLTLKQIRNRIFVGTEEVQHLYEDMTKAEAKAVLAEYGDNIDLDEGVPA